MTTYAFIFARGGSKGLPGKNLFKLGKLSLIGHSVNFAKSIDSISNVFVSSDSDKILLEAQNHGAVCIKRPKELAEDHSPEWLAWKHGISWVYENIGDFKQFLSLPTTCPLRSKIDVKNALESFKNNFDTMISVTESTTNPWFNMVNVDKNGLIRLANVDKKNKPVRRQDAPKCYDLCANFYITTPNFVLNNNSFWDGKVKPFFVEKFRSIDIDNKYDFELIEFFYNKLILGGENNEQ